MYLLKWSQGQFSRITDELSGRYCWLKLTSAKGRVVGARPLGRVNSETLARLGEISLPCTEFSLSSNGGDL